MEIWQFVLTVITTLTVGGVITSVLTIKYTKAKAKEEALQAAQNTIDLQIKTAQSAAVAQIDNASKLIEMYKTSLKDIQDLQKEREKLLNDKIADLEKKVKDLQEDKDQLRKTQLQLIEEITQFRTKLT